MKIAIDISQIVYGTGVSVYTKELVRALLLTAPEHEYILYAGVLRRKKELENYLQTLHGSFRVVTLPIPPRVADYLWNRLRPFPIEVFLGQFDVLHTSDWTEPPTRKPKVTTIHDLSPVLYPNVTSERVRKVFEKKLALVKQENDLVIVPSKSIAEEVLELHIPSENVYTIPEAPNPSLLNAPSIDVRKRFGINGKYILAVGTAERKNLDRCIAAFQSLSDTEVSLVIVGEHKSNLPTSPNVLYTGFVSTHELANLYREAEVFLYASLYEGFGLPILEAYAMGSPVVTSNVGSMQEIGGESSVLVNPYDTNDIAQGIRQAISRKSQLQKSGKAFVKNYTWEKTALETLKIYKKAYESR